MNRRPLALVTGPSRGIGFELAQLLAADGHDLVLVARSTKLLDALASDLRTRHHAEVRTHAADRSSPGAAVALWRELDDVLAALDVQTWLAGCDSWHRRQTDGIGG